MLRSFVLFCFLSFVDVIFRYALVSITTAIGLGSAVNSMTAHVYGQEGVIIDLFKPWPKFSAASPQSQKTIVVPIPEPTVEGVKSEFKEGGKVKTFWSGSAKDGAIPTWRERSGRFVGSGKNEAAIKYASQIPSDKFLLQVYQDDQVSWKKDERQFCTAWLTGSSQYKVAQKNNSCGSLINGPQPFFIDFGFGSRDPGNCQNCTIKVMLSSNKVQCSCSQTKLSPICVNYCVENKMVSLLSKLGCEYRGDYVFCRNSGDIKVWLPDPDPEGCAGYFDTKRDCYPTGRSRCWRDGYSHGIAMCLENRSSCATSMMLLLGRCWPKLRWNSKWVKKPTLVKREEEEEEEEDEEEACEDDCFDYYEVEEEFDTADAFDFEVPEELQFHS